VAPVITLCQANTMQTRTMKTSFLWASVAAATAGFLFYNVMPLYLGQLQESTGLETNQIGLIASIYFLGFNVVSVSSYLWIRKVPPFQSALLGTIALIIVLLLATRSSEFLYQAIISAAIGGLSGGIGTIGVTIAGDADNNTRWYGIQVAAEALAGVVLLFLLPATLIPRYGFTGLIYGMVIMLLILIPSYLFLSRKPLQTAAQDTPDPGLQHVPTRSAVHAWMGLVAMACLFVGSAAVWAFVERIAAINEFDPQAVGEMLGFSLFFAVVGSLVAGAVSDRFGNAWPYILNCLVLLAGVITIAVTKNFVAYTLGACVFMFGWAAAFAYLFAIISDVDPNGRFIALSVPAVGLGSMVGPGIAGYVLTGDSTVALQVICIASILVALALGGLSDRPSE
jgi:predicted MFS family arabinose efflux permease